MAGRGLVDTGPLNSCKGEEMRLWHKSLIEYLPQQQLVAQWRECCLIASLLAKDHTPNHILVNPITQYDPGHYISYCSLVYKEAYERGYNIHGKTIKKLDEDLRAWQLYLKDALPWELDGKIPIDYQDLFRKWHDTRYAVQCYYNLEEKYDRGGIPDREWDKILMWTSHIGADLFPYMNPPL